MRQPVRLSPGLVTASDFISSVNVDADMLHVHSESF